MEVQVGGEEEGGEGREGHQEAHEEEGGHRRQGPRRGVEKRVA